VALAEAAAALKAGKHDPHCEGADR